MENIWLTGQIMEWSPALLFDRQPKDLVSIGVGFTPSVPQNLLLESFIMTCCLSGVVSYSVYLGGSHCIPVYRCPLIQHVFPVWRGEGGVCGVAGGGVAGWRVAGGLGGELAGHQTPKK